MFSWTRFFLRILSSHCLILLIETVPPHIGASYYDDAVKHLWLRFSTKINSAYNCIVEKRICRSFTLVVTNLSQMTRYLTNQCKCSKLSCLHYFTIFTKMIINRKKRLVIYNAPNYLTQEYRTIKYKTIFIHQYEMRKFLSSKYHKIPTTMVPKRTLKIKQLLQKHYFKSRQ